MEGDIDPVRLHRRVIRNFADDCAKEPPTKKAKTILPDSDTESDHEDDSQPTYSEERATDELDIYCQSTFASQLDEYAVPQSPLQFWKTQSKRFPKLSHIARSVYAITTSQNKSE